tara:strand:- start:995 stop:1753 length:759 start_codon:yes stop_codon:yes gene_type:complete
MSHYNSIILLLGTSFVFFLGSCATSKSSLINYQEKEISTLESQIQGVNLSLSKLEKENDNLKTQIHSLNLTIEGFESSKTPLVSTSTPTSKTSSQRSSIERKFASTAAFISFKRGGLENQLLLSETTMNRIISSAKTYIGTPHVMGGLTNKGIDCSGLIYQAFILNDITALPRAAQEQARYGTIISDMNQLRKGDLVFFTKTYSTKKFITHVGIYLAQNEFLHTSSSSGVSVADITSNYWQSKFVYGTRLTN